MKPTRRFVGKLHCDLTPYRSIRPGRSPNDAPVGDHGSVEWGRFWSVVVGLIAVWLLFAAVLWILRPRNVQLGELVRIVPDVLRLVRRLLGAGTVPLGVRAALVGLLAWLLNPIDLIPEFIPVLGPMDDVVVTVIVLRYVRRRLGDEELRRRWPGTDDGYRLLSGVIGGRP